MSQQRDQALDVFDAIASDYMGSPLELRDLIEAAVAVATRKDPLPEAVAVRVKEITGHHHTTYATAAEGLMRAHFKGTGNYWRCYLMDGRPRWLRALNSLHGRAKRKSRE